MKLMPLGKEKRVIEFDLVGQHPVQMQYDKRGDLFYVEDVLSAKEWAVKFIETRIKECESFYRLTKDTQIVGNIEGFKESLKIIEDALPDEAFEGGK